MTTLRNGCRQKASWCPAGPGHCEVCQRSSRTETVETDSLLTRTHMKGKNESISRGETWSNCSLPLSSWFPDITVVFLTLRGRANTWTSVPGTQSFNQTLAPVLDFPRWLVARFGDPGESGEKWLTPVFSHSSRALQRLRRVRLHLRFQHRRKGIR